jgi:hypothetical protein
MSTQRPYMGKYISGFSFLESCLDVGVILTGRSNPDGSELVAFITKKPH